MGVTAVSIALLETDEIHIKYTDGLPSRPYTIIGIAEF